MMSSKWTLKGDHPRLRGEKHSLIAFCCHGSGSPPPARGEVLRQQAVDSVVRITPACAGRRFDFLPAIRQAQDHPRLRGEKSLGHQRTGTGVGSPPPARGEVWNTCPQGQPCGITPACAGRRLDRFVSFIKSRDHPRLRGEKMNWDYAEPGALGSPPPARGEDGKDFLYKCRTGITPACAGRSFFGFYLVRPTKDHPRLRGEKCLFSIILFVMAGSPPPARGEVPICLLRCRTWGITPACAGRSFSQDEFHEAREDHPRLRGEKLYRLGSLLHYRGITPACAGRRLKKARSHAGLYSCPCMISMSFS